MKPLIILFAVFALNFSAFSAEVTHQVTKQLQGVANYVKGDMSKPVVFILHGFLTNNQFHTIGAMEDILQIEGYSTLSPNLTLGINLRKTPITCSSIHTHTLENDLLEVDAWMQWLEQQGHKQIILLGHSSGSHQLIDYLTHYNNPTIHSAILTSVFYLNGTEVGTTTQDASTANNMLKNNDKQPRSFSFLFCQKNYNATASSYLSYQSTTRERVITDLKNLKTPHTIIMGGKDERYVKVGKNWLNELKSTGTNLIVIDEANHFFSHAGESLLQDAIIKTLKQ